MKLQMSTFFTLCDYAFRCVFELAAYRSANPNGKISLKPLFVERGMMGLMCLAPVISRDDSSASCELLLHGAIWKKKSENWRCRDVFSVSTCFHMFPLLLVLRLGTYFAAFLFWLGLVFNISQGQAGPHLAPFPLNCGGQDQRNWGRCRPCKEAERPDTSKEWHRVTTIK